MYCRQYTFNVRGQNLVEGLNCPWVWHCSQIPGHSGLVSAWHSGAGRTCVSIFDEYSACHMPKQEAEPII